MKYIFPFLIAASFFGVSGCSYLASPNKDEINTQTSSDENGFTPLDIEVLSAFIDLNDANYALASRSLLICSDTVISEEENVTFGESLARRFSAGEIGQDMQENFDKRNKKSYQIKESLNISRSYTYLSEATIERMRAGKVGFEYEKVLKKEYPNAAYPIYFSNIGYDSSKKKAIFFFIRSLADSYYIVMAFENDKWKIETKRIASMA